MSYKQLSSFIKSFSLLLLLMISNEVFSQYQTPDSERRKFFNDFINLLHTDANTGFVINEDEIEGSAYLSDEFILSSILTNKNIRYVDIPLRYNIYNDVMEFKIGKDSIIGISNPEIIKEIKYGQETFTYIRSFEHGGFYGVKNEGKIQLLIKYHVSFHEAEPAAAFDQAKPPKFTRNTETTYLRVDQGKLIRVTKKKDLKTVFGEQTKEILALMKAKKLYIKKEGDLLKLVHLLNQNN